MKRSELIRHLSKNGCVLLREGSRHSIWRNIRGGHMTAIPRHNRPLAKVEIAPLILLDKN